MTDQRLRDLLVEGAVGVLPTDTLYGLVCRAEDPAAVSRLYQLKHREAKPGTLVAADPAQLARLGLPNVELDRATPYWPSPVSVLVLAPDMLSYVTQGLPELACRVVAGPSQLIALLRAVGPLLTSSANQPGEPPANTMDEAIAYFGDRVDFYIDGGDSTDALPSTLIRLAGKNPEILRHGAGTINAKEIS